MLRKHEKALYNALSGEYNYTLMDIAAAARTIHVYLNSTEIRTGKTIFPRMAVEMMKLENICNDVIEMNCEAPIPEYPTEDDIVAMIDFTGTVGA